MNTTCYYKLIKWVQLNPTQKRQYILPVTNLEIQEYLKNKNTISNYIIPVSKIKYLLLKILYQDNITEYWKNHPSN